MYLAVGRFIEASQEIQKAVVLQPGNLAAQLKHGNLLLLERKFDEARAAAEVILKQNPSDIRAEILLGSSYVGIVNLNDSPLCGDAGLIPVIEVRATIWSSARLQRSIGEVTG